MSGSVYIRYISRVYCPGAFYPVTFYPVAVYLVAVPTATLLLTPLINVGACAVSHGASRLFHYLVDNHN